MRIFSPWYWDLDTPSRYCSSPWVWSVTALSALRVVGLDTRLISGRVHDQVTGDSWIAAHGRSHQACQYGLHIVQKASPVAIFVNAIEAQEEQPLDRNEGHARRLCIW